MVDLNGDDRLDLASAAMGASVLLGQ